MKRQPADDNKQTDSEKQNSKPVPDWAVYGLPYPGERASGDVGIVERRGNSVFLSIIDVLGHGDAAHELAVRMHEYLRSSWSPDPAKVLLKLHEKFKGDRGAAVGLAVLDLAVLELRYVGAGNTTLRRLGRMSSKLVSADGTVGSRIRTPVVQKIRVSTDDVLVLHSDGVEGAFSEEEEPKLLLHNAQWVARDIVRRFGKQHDDATCVVFRWTK